MILILPLAFRIQQYTERRGPEPKEVHKQSGDFLVS